MEGLCATRRVFLRSPSITCLRFPHSSSVANGATFVRQRMLHYHPNSTTNNSAKYSNISSAWSHRTTNTITFRRPFSYTHSPRDNYRRFQRNNGLWQSFNYNNSSGGRYQRIREIMTSKVFWVVTGSGLLLYVLNLETVEVRLFYSFPPPRRLPDTRNFVVFSDWPDLCVTYDKGNWSTSFQHCICGS